MEDGYLDCSGSFAEGSFSNVFALFGIEPVFNLDEDLLRQNYFELCRKYYKNEEKLSLIHSFYQKIQNPLQRIDLLIQEIFPGKKDEEQEASLPDNILELYTEIEDLCLENCEKFIEKIKKLKGNVHDEIQKAFIHKDLKTIRLCQSQLKYYEKFLSTAYVRMI